MAKTNAQLKAELAAAQQQLTEAQEENEALRKRSPRARFPTGLWPNKKRKTVKHPEHQGSVRFVVPPEKEAGDYIWIDLSMWIYDPENSPVTYEENPPDYSFSMSPTTPEWEAEQEGRRIKALKKSGAIR
jgi:hypothetical protein